MLVLERKPGEQITFQMGDQTVVITYCQRRGQIIKLGIEADPSVVVWRSELGEWHKDPPIGA